jgi:hypothetical protein
MNRALRVLGILFTVTLLAGVAGAHPLSQGALDVVIHPDGRATMRARVTIEEVVITDMLAALPAAPSTRPSITDMYARHARYFAEHVKVIADGAPLTGRVVRVHDESSAASTQPATQPFAADREHVVYELEYAAPGGEGKRPAKVELRQDVLVGIEVAPGVTWEASYVVRIGLERGPVTEGLLLTAPQPVSYACDWTTVNEDAPAGAPPVVHVDHWRMVREYASHGVHHILSGYDHLLFVGALVLAATSLWDLLKVVTAFTLAHTITLALAALRLVSLPDGIVEPMIAGSIVVVAAQNVLWPKQAKGWTRLAAAFGFGLFHGLGFAGGLLDAMQAMSGTTILLSIAAFSVGVEIGHQIVVIPLFAALKLARRTRPEPEQRDRLSLVAQRYGSAVICLAGMYYLVAAMGSALSVAGHS